MTDEPDEFGLSDGLCVACDLPGRVDDLGLCEACTGKLERDLIRQRDWEYSATAFGLAADQREAVRRQAIAQFGRALELIAPAQPGPRQRKRRSRR